MGLGNTPQEEAYGRQIVGGRLPVVSGRSAGWKAGAGRLPQWIVDGGPLEFSFLIPKLERKLLQRDIGPFPKKGIAVTFIVHASRGEEATTTIRLSAVVAIAKGRTLADEGWQVFITGPDGVRYSPSEFDKLLSLSPVVRSRS
jgi:hypothetical protein